MFRALELYERVVEMLLVISSMFRALELYKRVVDMLSLVTQAIAYESSLNISRSSPKQLPV